MKNLFKKSWFINILSIGLILIIFLINLWIMSLKLTAPLNNDNLWSLAKKLSEGDYANIYAFVLKIVFYISIIPILLSGLSLIKKNSQGLIIAVGYFFVFDIALIVFHSIQNYLSIFTLVLIGLNFILIVGTFILFIYRNHVLNQTKDLQKNESEINLSNSKIPLGILLINIFSVIVFLTSFVIPLYSLVESGSIYNAIIIRVLFSGETNIDVIIYFIVNFVVFLFIFLYFAKCLTYYFINKERFIDESKLLIQFTFFATLLFFLMGLAMDMYFTLTGKDAQTIAFIPMLLMCIVILNYAILKGKYSSNKQIVNAKVKLKYAKIEPLVYVIILTAITVLMLFFPIVSINITYGSYAHVVDLTGFDLLRDYASLDSGYRLVAYILVVMLISVGMSLVVTLSSYLSKYKQFNSIVKGAAAINVFFVFVISISGYYFQIAQEINRVIIQDIINLYGASFLDGLEYDYTISTDAIYALYASVLVLILMFIRKAFDRDQMNILDSNLLPVDNLANSNGSVSSGETDDDSYEPSDPCPSFTDLDSKIELYKQDLEQRKHYQIKETTLNDLVNFVVEYARNSRLHLSYTPEDIATFVAGLGASKLSILQGMSGTGKTSLPKIFSEAIFGNCEIIEVESSWKDKNELLGYYNEFSMKYTPKKFTLALYKAVLNQEIFTFILLDEMNLSRIEYYFSDFISLMENEEHERKLKFSNVKLSRKEQGVEVNYKALENGHTLKIPSNVWFVGTANLDETTFAISDKVYDRAQTMNFVKRAAKVRNYSSPIPRQFFDYQTINNLLNAAKMIGNFDAESNELIQSVEILLAPFNISFGNRVLKQIEDFVNVYKVCFPQENVESEAIEKILLSKVVSKLEFKTIDDKEELQMEFEKLKLYYCADFIRRLDNE